MSSEDDFLLLVKGVIHVGANSGQEREKYHSLGLDVVWIEALESAYRELEQNIAPYPKQVAIHALLSDEDGKAYSFNVASNEGAASSIFDFGELRDIWPNVTVVEKQVLISSRLDTIVQEQGIQLAHYSALVMDVQGAELLVLKGLGTQLANFRFVQAEAADFESYIGCAKLTQLNEYLSKFGFCEVKRTLFAEHPSGGHYWDVVWERPPPVRSLIPRLRRFLGK